MKSAKQSLSFQAAISFKQIILMVPPTICFYQQVCIPPNGCGEDWIRTSVATGYRFFNPSTNGVLPLDDFPSPFCFLTNKNKRLSSKKNEYEILNILEHPFIYSLRIGIVERAGFEPTYTVCGLTIPFAQGIEPCHAQVTAR